MSSLESGPLSISYVLRCEWTRRRHIRRIWTLAPISLLAISIQRFFFSPSSSLLSWLNSPQVDEKLLYDTFSAFGVILTTPKIQRDPETGNSKGFAFINYASFEASDAAIEAMNGQYLCNRCQRQFYVLQGTKSWHISLVSGRLRYLTHSRRTARVRGMVQLPRGFLPLRIHSPRFPNPYNLSSHLLLFCL